MVEANIFDMLCDAIEEYSDYINRRNVTNLSYEEKRGIFYNCLRRKFGVISLHRKYSSSLEVGDLHCAFGDKGEITAISINRSFSPSYNWDGGLVDTDRLRTLNTLKTIVNSTPFWYPTRVLNEMSYIVNSVKIT